MTRRLTNDGSPYPTELQLRAFLAHSPHLAFMKNAAGRYVYVNPRMEQEFGIRASDLCGKADLEWLPEELARPVEQSDRDVLASGGTRDVIEALPGRDGHVRHWLVTKFLVTGDAGDRFVGGIGTDVTAMKQAEARLAESEDRFRRLVEHSQGLICTHDEDGRILSANAAALRVLGLEESELVGRSLRDILSPTVRSQFPRYLERIRSTGEDAGLMVVVAKGGSVRTWQYHNVYTHDDAHGAYVLGHAQDVTELRSAVEELRTLALTDDLTGLLNRRGFLHHATRSLHSYTSLGLPAALFYVDVDGLKKFNDQFGHESGSKMICAAADVLRQTFRAADVLGRIGGDEFAVLTQLSPSLMPIIRNRLRAHVERVNAGGTLAGDLRLSVGMAHCAATEPTTLDDLLRTADANMYDDKDTRRD